MKEKMGHVKKIPAINFMYCSKPTKYETVSILPALGRTLSIGKD